MYETHSPRHFISNQMRWGRVNFWGKTHPSAHPSAEMTGAQISSAWMSVWVRQHPCNADQPHQLPGSVVDSVTFLHMRFLITRTRVLETLPSLLVVRFLTARRWRCTRHSSSNICDPFPWDTQGSTSGTVVLFHLPGLNKRQGHKSALTQG